MIEIPKNHAHYLRLWQEVRGKERIEKSPKSNPKQVDKQERKQPTYVHRAQHVGQSTALRNKGHKPKRKYLMYAITKQGGLVACPFNWPGFEPGYFALDTNEEAISSFFARLSPIGAHIALYEAHSARERAERSGLFDFTKVAWFPKPRHMKDWKETPIPSFCLPKQQKDETSVDWDDIDY